jgi:hypothetical protein
VVRYARAAEITDDMAGDLMLSDESATAELALTT